MDALGPLMKREIEVRTTKGMRASNAIAKDLEQMFDPVEELKRLEQMANVLGFHLKGPLIIRRYPLEIDGTLHEKGEILIPCTGHVPADLPSDLRHIPEMHSGDDILAHFVGREENLGVVTNKISVYAYENDLTLTGETYTINLDREGPIITVDVRCPITRGRSVEGILFR